MWKNMIIPHYCDRIFSPQSCKLKSSKENSPRKHHTPDRQSPCKTHKQPWTALPISSVVLRGRQSKCSGWARWFLGGKESWGRERQARSRQHSARLTVFAAKVCWKASKLNQHPPSMEKWANFSTVMGWMCSGRDLHLGSQTELPSSPLPAVRFLMTNICSQKTLKTEQRKIKSELKTCYRNKTSYGLFVNRPSCSCSEHFLFMTAENLKPQRPDFYRKQVILL